MKVLLITLLLSINQEITFEEVDKAVEERQYSKAFSLLTELDPDNANPEAFRRKIEICIDHYVTSLGHRMFALKNLEAGEEVQEIRGQEGVYDMYALDVETIAPVLMEAHPEDYQLKFAVGRYYHSMHLNCGDCSISSAECISQFERLFTEAYEHDVYDYFSLYGIAYAKISKQEYKASIPYFLKSIELKDDYATSHYNLAIAYLYTKEVEKSVEYAKNAVARYDYYPTYQADAARIAAIGYENLEDFENAYQYFKKADEINPDDFYNLKPLLNISLRLKKEDSEAIRESLFLLDPDNPTVYNELIYAYTDHGDIKDLLAYFELKCAAFQEAPASLGSLYFYIGKIQLELGNTKAGKEALVKAKNKLAEVYKADHQVFPVIDQLLEEADSEK